MEAVLTQAINRLESVLVGETLALREGRNVSVTESSNRKNQCLLELSRISRGLDPAAVTPNLKVRLSGLRDRLEDNRQVLWLHMEATGEITRLIAKAMSDAESDGTYGSAVTGVKRDR